MTLTTTTSRVTYPGAGSTGPFAIPFRFFGQGATPNTQPDLLVTKRLTTGAELTLTVTADYTVTGTGDATSSLTLLTALAAGETLTIRRSPALTQPASIRNQGAFFPSTHEDEFDRLVMQLQSIKDQVDRSVKLSETFDPAGFNLSLLTPTAGQVVTGTGSGFTMATIATSAAVALPGGGRTVPTLSAYLQDNSVWNILDFGAVINTDCTVAIQAALDKGGRVVCPDPGILNYYGITSLIIRANTSFATAVQFIGDGGRVTLKYLGTGAAAASMLVVDKTTYNAGNNYKDIAIEGFVIDGNNNALFGLNFNGFTRRCSVKRTYIVNCVCPAKVINGFYSLWEHVEFGTTPFQAPAGMNGATYAANLYGVYLDTCQLARFTSCVFYTIGGNVSNPYTAALRVGQSDGVKFDSTSFEAMQQTDHKITKLIILAGQTTLKMSTIYLELVETTLELIQMDDNTILDTENWFLNGIVATSFVKAVGRAPIRVGTLDAENVDFSVRLFDLSSGTEFTNLSIDRISFGVGAQVSTQFDANTTVGSKKGVSCSPILLDNKRAAFGTGYVTSGYTPSLGATFVDISSGTAFLNGQPVGFSKNSGVSQRLYPDLSLAGTWNIMISPAGTPYIEIQSAVRAESTYALRIGTFTTPGGAGAPAGLLTPINSKSRINGAQVDVPKTVNTLVARQLSGWISCASGVATSLMTMTLSPTAGEDDALSVTLEFVAMIGAGANRSIWRGYVTAAFTQDASPNRVNVTSAVFGDAKALDASVATWTLTFAQSVAGNVSTLQATSTTASGDAVALEFTGIVKGGARATSACALVAAATVGE